MDTKIRLQEILNFCTSHPTVTVAVVILALIFLFSKGKNQSQISNIIVIKTSSTTCNCCPNKTPRLTKKTIWKNLLTIFVHIFRHLGADKEN